MKNLFLNQIFLLFGILILTLSCSVSDEISDENLIVTEAFDYQRFYEDYKSEIHKLTRDEFAGLNVNLRLLAIQDFSKEKNTSGGMTKLTIH